jgi:hypothetical protein
LGGGVALSPTDFLEEEKKGATRSLNQVDNQKVCLEDDHGSTNSIIETVDSRWRQMKRDEVKPMRADASILW